MKYFKWTVVPVVASLLCALSPSSQAQWIQNGSVGPFSYTDPANWNGGVINNQFLTNVTTGLTITFPSDFTLTSQVLLGWSNNAAVTFASASGVAHTIKFSPSGGFTVTNAAGGTITIGTSNAPLILDLNGATNCTIGGVPGTSGSANIFMNVNAQVIDSAGGSNALKVGGDRVFTYLLNTNNSFVGPLNFYALRGGGFSNLKNIGSGPSAAGAPTDSTNGTISAADNNSNGSLRYTGSGDTSDRPFVWNIGFSNAVGNAFQFANAGTGLLKLTGPWSFPAAGTNGTQFVVNATNAPIELDGYIHGAGNTNGTYTFICFSGGPGSTGTNQIILTGPANDFRDFMISNVVLNYNGAAPSGVPSPIGAGTNVVVGGGSQSFGGWQTTAGQGSSLRYNGTTNLTFTRNVILNGTGFYWALDNAATNTVLTLSNNITWNQGTNPSVSFNPRFLYINPLPNSTNAVYSYIPDAGIVTGATPVGVTLGVGNPVGITVANGGLVQLLNPTNTFAGGVLIAYARTIQAMTLADIGQPSSIGTGANGTVLSAFALTGINLGSPDSSRGGTLSFIGTTNTTSNQKITIFGPTFNSATLETCAIRNDSSNGSSLHLTDTGNWSLLPQGTAIGTNNYIAGLGGSAKATNTLDSVISDLPNSGSIITPNSGHLLVNGSAWRLTAAQAYTGTTTVANATLLIDGSIATGLGVTVSAGGVLTGTGTINENVNVLTNGTVGAGDGAIGALTVNGNLTNAGTIFMKLNKTAGNNDQLLLGGNTIAYGGVLSVSNISGTLTTNDSFHLFTAGTYNGSFASISPAVPGNGLAWDLTSLPTTGTLKITVGTTLNPPTITSFNVAGSNLVLNGTNGSANGSFHVVSTTNVTQSMLLWTNVGAGSFDGSGNFSFTVTNIVQPSVPQQYFRMLVP